MKQNIIISEDSLFSIQKTDLLGKAIEGEMVSSYQFILDGIKILNREKDSPNFRAISYEYSSILKELIKEELLDEMANRINNIRTFYR